MIVLSIVTNSVTRQEAKVVSFSVETNKAIHDIVLERALTDILTNLPCRTSTRRENCRTICQY